MIAEPASAWSGMKNWARHTGLGRYLGAIVENIHAKPSRETLGTGRKIKVAAGRGLAIAWRETIT